MRGIRELIQGNRLIFYLSLIFLGVVLILWLVANRRNLQECLASYRMRNRELAKVRALEKRLEGLQEEKRLLENGTEESEIAARNRFRMAKEGERLVIVEREVGGE